MIICNGDSIKGKSIKIGFYWELKDIVSFVSVFFLAILSYHVMESLFSTILLYLTNYKKKNIKYIITLILFCYSVYFFISYRKFLILKLNWFDNGIHPVRVLLLKSNVNQNILCFLQFNCSTKIVRGLPSQS